MSKLRHYETMFIVKPTLTEEETVAQIDAVKATIEKNGGEIVGQGTPEQFVKKYKTETSRYLEQELT